MFKKLVWPSIVGISVLMIIIFVGGLFRVMSITYGDGKSKIEQGINNQGNDNLLNEENDLSKNPSNDNKVILIIGDSIGAGIGDERNLGLGERYISQLDFEEGDLYDVVNFSVPGAVTNDLSESVLSGEIDEVIKDSNLIFISIGGNDMNHIRNSDTTVQIIRFEEALAEHLDDLNKVLSYIQELNSKADIAIIGLYNPHVDVNEEDIRLLQQWNYQTRINVLEFDNTNIIPLYDLFEMNLDKLLFIDQFHPNGDGYELIAEMIKKILN
jgi:lysophospholipase L1-like esterase